MKDPTILKKYEKEWIALTPDRSRVINAAKTLKGLLSKIKNIKNSNTVITYVLPFDGYYSPLCSC